MKNPFLRYFLILSIGLLLIYSGYAQIQYFKYNDAIKSGNTYYQSGDYVNAKLAFQLASRIKPNDEYAKEMVAITLDLIRGEANKRKAYTNLLVEADKFFSELKLELALNSYQQALALFPYEKYPAKQIERINLIILENQEIIRDNEAAIIEGDRLFSIMDYDNAMVEFQYALSLIPGQEYPKERLRQIRRILAGLDEKTTDEKKGLGLKTPITTADSISLRQSLLNRLPSIPEDSTQILNVLNSLGPDATKADSINALYNKALELEANGDLEGAVNLLRAALEIDPNNELIQQKLAQLLNKLNNIESIFGKESSVNELLKKVKELEEIGDLYGAERLLRDALNLDPENDLIRQRLEALNEKIAAKRTTPLEDYENAIRQGNKLMLEGKTEEAQKYYDFAARLRPTAGIPDASTSITEASKYEQLKGANSSQSELLKEARNQLKAGNLASAERLLQLSDSLNLNISDPQLNALYDSINQQIKGDKNAEFAFRQYLREAEALLNAGRLEEAKIALDRARELAKSANIDQAGLEKLTQLQNIYDQKKRVSDLIKSAEEALLKGNLEKADELYRQALALDPNQLWITQKLSQIQELMADEKVKNQFLYDEAIKEADRLLKLGDFLEAKALLDRADSLNQLGAIPSDMISRLDSSYRFQYEVARERYEALIVNGDYYYRQGEFDKALQSYVDARELFPFEPYPIEMIKRITNKFASSTLQTIVSDSTQLTNGGILKLNFEPVDITDRRDIYFYLKLRNPEQVKNLKVILNYGRDAQKNGGVIIRMVESDLTTDYLVRVGNQYRWFSEDNNWITLLAEGGSIDLISCTITREEK